MRGMFKMLKEELEMGTVIKFEIWEPICKEITVEYIDHEYAVGTENFVREINKYVMDNYPLWQEYEPTEIKMIRWEIDGVGQGHYVPFPNPWMDTVEETPDTITWEGLMHDYALWVGRSIVMDELGAEFSANRLSPQQYIEEFLEMAFTPRKDEVFTFLSQFYTEDTEVYAFIDKFVWDDEE